MSEIPFAGGHIDAIMSGSNLNFPLLMISIIISVIIAMILLFTFGLSMLIGMVFIVYAGISLALNRGRKYKDEMIIIFILIGVFFISLSYLGVDIMVIDVSNFPPAQRLYAIMH